MSKNIEREQIIKEIVDRIGDAADELKQCKELAHPYQPDPEVRMWIAEAAAKLDAWKEALDEVMGAYSDGDGPEELQELFCRRSLLYHEFAEEQRRESGRGTVFRRLDTHESVFSRAGSLIEETADLDALDDVEFQRIENSVRRSRGKPVIDVDQNSGDTN